jgi:hypothetical protein
MAVQRTGSPRPRSGRSARPKCPLATMECPLCGDVWEREPRSGAVLEEFIMSEIDLLILTWRSACADCGDAFTLTSGLSVRHLNRRCPAHHRPGVPVRAARRAWRWRGAHG